MAFDFKREYRALYQPRREPALIDVPGMHYVAVEGRGDPNDPQLLMGENWEASLYVLRETGYTMMIVQLCVGLGIVLIGAVLLIVFNRLKPVEGETVYVNESPDDLVDPSELGTPAEGIIPEQAEATEDEGFTEYTEE